MIGSHTPTHVIYETEHRSPSEHSISSRRDILAPSPPTFGSFRHQLLHQQEDHWAIRRHAGVNTCVVCNNWCRPWLKAHVFFI